MAKDKLKTPHLTAGYLNWLGDSPVTAYCQICGESPESGTHIFYHEYVPPGEKNEPKPDPVKIPWWAMFKGCMKRLFARG